MKLFSPAFSYILLHIAMQTPGHEWFFFLKPKVGNLFAMPTEWSIEGSGSLLLYMRQQLPISEIIDLLLSFLRGLVQR
jgi:hypothetical protein